MSTRLHILDLPVDVLALILAPLLASPVRGRGGGPVFPLCVCAGARPRAPAAALPLLLSHPALHAVAVALLYGGANRFELDLRGEHGGHVRSYLREAERREREGEREWEDGGAAEVPRDGRGGAGGGFLLLGEGPRRRVRRMEIRLDRLRGWVDEGITPLVEDMLMRGALGELDVVLELGAGGAARRGARGPAAGMGMGLEVFARPPLGGLLRLLADPDLRRARLRISRAHGDAWCAFHEGGCGGMKLGRDGEEDGEEDGEDGDGGLVEVDWRAIVRELDPEGRGRAVAPLR